MVERGIGLADRGTFTNERSSQAASDSVDEQGVSAHVENTGVCTELAELSAQVNDCLLKFVRNQEAAERVVGFAVCLSTVAIRDPLLSGLVAHRTQEELTKTVCGFGVFEVLESAFESRCGHDRRGSGNTTAAFCCLLLDKISDKSDSGLCSLVFFFVVFHFG